MVQKLDVKRESVMKVNVYELNLHLGDTIVLQFDLDIFDLDEIQQVHKIWAEAYPNNNIMSTLKGIEVKGVIHNV